MRITLLLTFFLLVISCGSGNETTSATTDEQNYFTLSEKTGYSLTELLDEGNKILQDVAQGLVLNAAAIADRGVIVQAVKDINKALVDISNNVNVENSINIISASVKRYEASFILLRDKEILDSFFSKMMYLSAVYAERLNMEIPRYSGYNLLNLKMSDEVREEYFSIKQSPRTPSWSGGAFRGTPFFKFDSGSFKDEAWLISPKYDLKNKFPYTIEIDHTLRNVSYRNIKLMISTNYNGGNPSSANWDEYSLDNGSDIPANRFFNTKSLPINIEKYTGKQIIVAFKVNTNDGDIFTWQVNGFQIKGIGDNIPSYTYKNNYNPVGGKKLLELKMTSTNRDLFIPVAITDGASDWRGGNYGGDEAIQFRTNKKDSESWLLSPKFDLTKSKPKYLFLSHTLKDISYNNIKLLVSKNYDGGKLENSNWEEYSLNHGGKIPANTFLKTNSIPINIEKYIGEKIVIAFKVTTKKNDNFAWQIRGVNFTGSSGKISYSKYKNNFKKTLLKIELNPDNQKSFKDYSYTQDTPRWKAGEYRGTPYMQYKAKKVFSESWLISPTYDLTKANVSNLAVSSTFRDLRYEKVKLLISKDYSKDDPKAASWDEYSLSHGGDIPQGSFFNATSLPIDIEKYNGEKITLAFKIESDESDYLTWQLKTFVFKGTNGEIKVIK